MEILVGLMVIVISVCFGISIGIFTREKSLKEIDEMNEIEFEVLYIKKKDKKGDNNE